MLGPKGPTVAAEGCRPLQELEKAARRAAIFLVYIEKLKGIKFLLFQLVKVFIDLI